MSARDFRDELKVHVGQPVAGVIQAHIDSQAAEVASSQRKEDAMSADKKPGAWFVYGIDWNAYPSALFADELEARRFTDARGYGEVVFWPFGEEWPL